ncbi:hypothetical protein ACFYWN_44035 [Streptomyces sp. NPDC002917]
MPLATWIFHVSRYPADGYRHTDGSGQHRAQAMLEAGVRRTVVLHHVYET